MEVKKSERLKSVNYAIRGPVYNAAYELEKAGQKILKLNIGNPAQFGFDTDDIIKNAIIKHINAAQGYCHSQGLIEAREAVKKYNTAKGIKEVSEEDIFIGNGASELITMSLQALINPGDEVLVPAPDYPLWTASVNLASGNAIHYICDEQSGWNPDINDLRKKVTKKTKAVVIINPNNPTGSVYTKETIKEIIEICRQNNLVLFSDEIYDRVVYDGKTHISPAALADDILVINFNGLSKVFRACGFRLGWMILNGNKKGASDFIDGLKVLSTMRLCSNVLSQVALKAAIESDNSIKALVEPGGRLREQRDAAWKLLNDIPGVSCVKAEGALYMFPKIDSNKYGIKNDVKFILDLLNDKKVLFVEGTGFNWKEPNHFRIVFLPEVKDLQYAISQLKDFLVVYKQN
ncbi:MAG: pyridoxal phosphate-dependent aminotransferase [Spirochaetaceae bacterium]|nr:pyridoxal phosphate-dependent aminotransferase [Spirochaetaceae bacterium]